MDGREKKKIRAAFDYLDSLGISLSVPGWFELSDSDDAIEFVSDPDAFYEARNPDYRRG